MMVAPEFAVAALSENSELRQEAPLELECGDRDAIFLAVEKWGLALQYASQELRDDSEVVLTAVSQDSEAFQFASNRLQMDAQIALVALSGASWASCSVPNALWAD